MTRTALELPVDFSPEKFFAKAFDMLGGAGDHRIVIRLTAAVADRIREREWHASALSPRSNAGS